MCIKLKDPVAKSICDVPNLLWFCEDCIGIVNQNLKMILNVESIKVSAKVAEEKSESCLKAIEEIKSKINQDLLRKRENEDPGKKKRSYATALSEGTVVVKPSSACDNKITKEKIDQHMDPARLGIGIRGIRDAKDGAVVIKCRDKRDADKLKRNLELNMGEGYSASIPAKKNPCIKIVDIESHFSEEELTSKLKQQNSYIFGDSHLRVVVIKKMVKFYMAIIECDAQSFGRYESTGDGRLYIDTRACRSFEHVGIMRCFKCHGYRHTSNNCTNEKVCGKCSSKEHETKECENVLKKCINCKLANDKYGMNLDLGHSVFDMKCQTYTHILKKEKTKIGYSQ